MARKKDESQKKGPGQARQAQKAEAAGAKRAAEDKKLADLEATKWKDGAKNTSKKEAEAEKKAEQARKKAEKEALRAEEENSLPSRAAPKNSKTAAKKTNRGLDLSQLDDNKAPALEASNIDDALKITGLDAPSSAKIERHPEKRVGAAWRAFSERRLQEMRADGSGKGLNRDQMLGRISTEFKKSEENPINKAAVAYNASKEDRQQFREAQKAEIEGIYQANI
ncbi:hypothetical protein F4780DRAFT_732628 [Xylariomycetidae sp. FL0641]|nr:hypothetical protein F4780DRAFT_732628 [Xylariomycetidae sp. FL0641]